MSPNRLVIQRWWGLPLTLLNKIGQPPSNCFWMPGRSKCIYDNSLKVNERSNDTRTRSRQSYAGNGTFVPRDQSAFGRSDPLQLADGLLSLPELFLDLLGRIYDGRCSTF